MIPPHPWGLFFKVQRANVVSRCDKFYYLGPVVKPRDDKKDVIDITWVPWSASTHEN